MEDAAAPKTPRWRNCSLPAGDRAAALVSQLTLEEKIGQLMMQCPAIPRLGIPAYDWWSEALHGVGRNGFATVFPQAIGLAATWNPHLLGLVAEVVATEARAKHHEAVRACAGASGRYQGLTLWSPNVNLFRDPRWGRGQECYGEDVHLTACLGAAFVRGLQGDDPWYLKTVATPKHFAVHNGPENGRFSFNAVVSPRDLWEEELSVFEFVIRDGGAWSVMSAYNAINGTPCCANHWLLTEVLRERWGFRGAVVGDVDNVAHLSGAMGYVMDAPTACGLAIRAGQDLCSGLAFESLGEAVRRNLVTEGELDANLTRNLELRFRLGMFDPPESVPYAAIPISVVDAKEHDAIALEAAHQSIVLLKNDGALPLDLSMVRTVAILGPTADSRAALLGTYAGTPSHPVDILSGLRESLESAGVKTMHYRAVPLVDGFERRGYPLGESRRLYADAEGREPGLNAKIYVWSDLAKNPVGERRGLGLDLFWNIYQPSPPIPPEHAGIQWSGYVVPPATGNYTFTVETIGRFSLSVAGNVLVQELNDTGVSKRRSQSVSIVLEADRAVPITIEFRQTGLDALFSISWKTPLDPEDNLTAALTAARGADHIILCLGLTPEVEGEEMPVDLEGFKAGDRTTIQLPSSQRELLAEAAALGRPLTVILTTGSAIALDATKANAILCAWYYGQRGGEAVADVLLGKINPAGRLPVTFYASDQDLPPMKSYSMEGRTYKFLRCMPLFAFGHGLSYTKFVYGQPLLESATIIAGTTAVLKIAVTNSGERDGDEVVEVYARNPRAAPDRPVRQLIGFQRQFIAAAQTVQMAVNLDTRILRQWDERRQEFVYQRGIWTLEIGPASDRLLQSEILTIT